MNDRNCDVLATLSPYDVSSKLEINLQGVAGVGEYVHIGMSDNADMKDAFTMFCAPDFMTFTAVAYGVDDVTEYNECPL